MRNSAEYGENHLPDPEQLFPHRLQGLSEVVHFSGRQWQYQDVIKFYQTKVEIIQKGLPFIVRSLEITKFKVYTGKQHLLVNGK